MTAFAGAKYMDYPVYLVVLADGEGEGFIIADMNGSSNDPDIENESGLFSMTESTALETSLLEAISSWATANDLGSIVVTKLAESSTDVSPS